jgi:hypothetical protein
LLVRKDHHNHHQKAGSVSLQNQKKSTTTVKPTMVFRKQILIENRVLRTNQKTPNFRRTTDEGSGLSGGVEG